MALQNEGEQLTAAWRALDKRAEVSGWQLIDVSATPSVAVMAGRKGPGNEEALLIGITDLVLSSDMELPHGQGFLVVRTELQGDRQGPSWLAVLRQPSGQLPLFTLMASDLVGLLRKAEPGSANRLYSLLIARLKAWQRFMSRERPQVLTAEEEVGLVGELVVLRDLMSAGVPEDDAIEAWAGPDDGLHDFIIGTGGIEAKTTVAPMGFIARIGNLDQLDDSLYKPLYVGAVRLGQSDTGKSLPQIVDELLEVLADYSLSAKATSKLASVGYIEVMREHYKRKFLCKDLTYRLVDEGTPRLTRSSVPLQILDARYSLDLDSLAVVASKFVDISASMGMHK